MLKNILLFSLLVICFTHCTTLFPTFKKSSKQKRNATELVGTWVSDFSMYNKIEFTADGYFNAYNKRYGKEIFKFSTTEGDKLIEEDYGNMLYDVEIKGDSFNIILTGEKNQKVFAKRTIFIDGDCLTEVIYKEGIKDGIDINNHIQVAYGYNKENSTEKCTIDAPRLVFILPNDFTQRKVFMAFGQPDGISGHRTSNGNIEYEVPNANTIKIKELENVRSFTWGLVDFYIKNEAGIREKINVAYNNQVNTFLNSEFDIDTPIIYIGSRFNSGRKRVINKLFGEAIKGNVLDFRMSTIREDFE